MARHRGTEVAPFTAVLDRTSSLGLALLLAGCGFEAPGRPGDGVGDPPEVDAASDSDAASIEVDAGPPTPEVFDMNRLLEDEQILGGAATTAAEIQAFLEAEGSYLATYVDPASQLSAAEIIGDRCAAHGIDPLYMLARIQTESSLVSSGSAANLTKATGCGCPDASGCDPMWAGFANQIECAASKTRGYFDDLDAGQPTIAGWNVGLERDTFDPCAVTPANKATAALYTYTPWVGAYAETCGRADVGGSSLVARVYYRFRERWGAGPL